MSSSNVPSMGRRQFMNLLTFGTATGVALGALYPVVNYFIPQRAGGGGGGAGEDASVHTVTAYDESSGTGTKVGNGGSGVIIIRYPQ